MSVTDLLAIGRRKTLPIYEAKALVYKGLPADQVGGRRNMRFVWNSIFASEAVCHDAYVDKKTQTIHVYTVQNDPKRDTLIGVNYKFNVGNKMTVEISHHNAINITQMRNVVRSLIGIK